VSLSAERLGRGEHVLGGGSGSGVAHGEEDGEGEGESALMMADDEAVYGHAMGSAAAGSAAADAEEDALSDPSTAATVLMETAVAEPWDAGPPKFKSLKYRV
jgi:hypothetical protein